MALVDRSIDPATVTAWCDKWAQTMAESHASCGLLVLEAGHLEAARLIHAELTRRFPERLERRFLELDRRLAQADARGATMTRIRQAVDDHHAEGNRPADVGGYHDEGGWSGAPNKPETLPDDDSEEIEL